MSVQITVVNWNETPRVFVRIDSDIEKMLMDRVDTSIFSDPMAGFTQYMEEEGYEMHENEYGTWEHEAPYLCFPRRLIPAFEQFMDCKLFDEDDGSYFYEFSTDDLRKFIMYTRLNPLWVDHRNSITTVYEYAKSKGHERVVILG